MAATAQPGNASGCGAQPVICLSPAQQLEGEPAACAAPAVGNLALTIHRKIAPTPVDLLQRDRQSLGPAAPAAGARQERAARRIVATQVATPKTRPESGKGATPSTGNPAGTETTLPHNAWTRRLNPPQLLSVNTPASLQMHTLGCALPGVPGAGPHSSLCSKICSQTPAPSKAHKDLPYSPWPGRPSPECQGCRLAPPDIQGRLPTPSPCSPTLPLPPEQESPQLRQQASAWGQPPLPQHRRSPSPSPLGQAARQYPSPTLEVSIAGKSPPSNAPSALGDRSSIEPCSGNDRQPYTTSIRSPADVPSAPPTFPSTPPGLDGTSSILAPSGHRQSLDSKTEASSTQPAVAQVQGQRLLHPLLPTTPTAAPHGEAAACSVARISSPKRLTECSVVQPGLATTSRLAALEQRMMSQRIAHADTNMQAESQLDACPSSPYKAGQQQLSMPSSSDSCDSMCTMYASNLCRTSLPAPCQPVDLPSSSTPLDRQTQLSAPSPARSSMLAAYKAMEVVPAAMTTIEIPSTAKQPLSESARLVADLHAWLLAHAWSISLVQVRLSNK